ncbi:alpha-2-macroglobulin family protein [Fimbriimonas ginsengisoli]|uniref:Alpha-2-macroglobulin domain-containing protein n=1 Tax=Fimbriimonas ginsengisoli Gsoil 348 TaxID=661478 RepID=A0A068NVT2_FIMGI|nr:MG2 domain-containing protein [Fimbriimonas ginsengisoli]AIE87613.1 alpha-2-macroglobulin domain-containing protein [Fimbriimonas ginsengisoli Gsoil 348]
MSAVIALLLAGVLGQGDEATAPVKELRHEINVWVARNVAPGPKVRLNMNTRNVPVVHVSALPVDGSAWMRVRDKKHDRPAPIGPAVKSWDVTVADPKSARGGGDHYFTRQVNLPLLKPGVYLLSVRGAGKEATAVVNVTNLAVVVKRSPKRVLAWVTDFKTGAVQPGAEVALYGRNGEPRGRGRTGTDGVAIFEAKPGNDTLVVRRGDDLAGIDCGAEDPDGHLRAHFQTDRPIYRPGQTVYYKAILRLTKGRSYVPVVKGEVVATLRDPKDNPLDQFRIRPNPQGSIAGSFKVPEEGMAGPYTIVLDAAGQQAFETFTVASYRKPEFKVEAQAAAKRYLAGQTLKFTVSSAYYFGAPVPQAHVRWTVRGSRIPFFTAGAEERWFYGGDGNLYPSDTYATTPFVGEGETVTDNDGKATIEIESDPAAGDQSYDLSITVEDESRRQVTGGTSVPVYAAAIRIGLTSGQSVTPLGGLIPVEVRAVDLDGRPIGAKVDLRLFEPEWVEKEGRFRKKLLADRTVTVPPTGKLVTELPARAEGSLSIEAVAPDGTGRKAKSSLEVYVAGPDYKAPRENPQPQIDLRLDRRVYVPGQAATAYMTTNRPNRPALLVLEGGDIFAYRVLPGRSSGRSWRFNTSVEQSPNGYVTVDQWSEQGLQSGSAVLPVPDPTRQITVETIPDQKELRPGDHARIRVRTLDSKGHPIPAEVALSVVDEAIYALSPDTTADPYGFYWGRREDGVSTTSTCPEEVSGGAYQRANAVAPVRQRFEDTAYWNAFVSTGPGGVGVAEFEVPGNLTTWRATARGVTADTQVGIGRSSFVATRPLTLRLATPRVVAQGDEFTLIGTVNNRSDGMVSTQVTLEGDGIGTPGTPTTVEMKPRSQQTVKWRLNAAKVPASGRFTLLAKANGPTADLSDALQVSVPIVPQGVRETVQAAGAMRQDATVKLPLPSDAMGDGATLSIRVFAGVAPAMRQTAERVLRSGRYGSPAAANGLIAVASAGRVGHEDDAREALALLSRTEHPDGWGWWDNAPSDPVITARVGHAISVARNAGVSVFPAMLNAAKNGARAQYDRSPLWEHRALLAASMVELNEEHGKDSIAEVSERGIHLSPYARLRLAEALAPTDRASAQNIVGEVTKLVSDGPGAAFVPVGEGLGWTASEGETTAELLLVLSRLGLHADLQDRLVTWLVTRDEWSRSMDEDATIAYALSLYAKNHPSATSIGSVTAIVNGKSVALKPSTVDASSSIDLPLDSLPTESIKLARDGGGEVMFNATLRYYRNVLVENATGVRVNRRYEVKNEAGVWSEVDRVIRPGEPVRCTVVVWGDDRSDAVRITEPIPAGFEFVEGEYTGYVQEDVRDGVVIHHLVNAGAPAFFRYYLRAESDGNLIALPAIAEYLRRPQQRGQSAATKLVVHP